MSSKFRRQVAELFTTHAQWSCTVSLLLAIWFEQSLNLMVVCLAKITATLCHVEKHQVALTQCVF